MEKGTIVANEYKLIKLLGRGSFGEVWLANNILANVEEAIKLYNSLDNKGLEEFVSEYKVARQLNHPNLLHINHLGVWDGRPYLVMPYCPNGTAERLIANASEKDIWRFIRDVSAGLVYLHSQHPMIIHQDIKPSNILIEENGNFVISDFGISRKITTTLRAKSSNVIGTSGTMAYMGPELFDSTPMLVAATDMWALGMSLYEIITGELAWNGLGGCAQLNGAKIPNIEQNYSQELKDFVVSCLSEKPWNRPLDEDALKIATQMLTGQNTVKMPRKTRKLPSELAVENTQKLVNENTQNVQSKNEDTTVVNNSTPVVHHLNNSTRKYKEDRTLTFLIAILVAAVIGIGTFVFINIDRSTPTTTNVSASEQPTKQQSTPVADTKKKKQVPQTTTKPQHQQETKYNAPSATPIIVEQKQQHQNNAAKQANKVPTTAVKTATKGNATPPANMQQTPSNAYQPQYNNTNYYSAAYDDNYENDINGNAPTSVLTDEQNVRTDVGFRIGPNKFDFFFNKKVK